MRSMEAEDTPGVAVVIELVVGATVLLLTVVEVRLVDKDVVETKSSDVDVVMPRLLEEDVVEARLLEEEEVGPEEVTGQLETLAVTVRGVPLTADVPVWVMVVVSVTTCVEDR